MGRWRKCRRRFKMQTLTCCRSQNREHAHSSGSVTQFKGQFNGAMEDMSGKVQNANTHILRAKITSTRTAVGQFKGQFQGGDGMLHVGSTRGKAHPLPHTHIAMVSTPVGRWRKVQAKVQDASTHILRRKSRAHTQWMVSSRVSSVGRWRTCQGRFKMQTLTCCEPKSRARAQQPVSSMVGSMGRWRKDLGKGRKRAHISRFVVMNIAGIKVSHPVGSD